MIFLFHTFLYQSINSLKKTMKQLKYYLLFVFFAGVYSVVKIVVFKNEIDRLFVLETLVTSVIVVVVVVFLNNYSETNT